MRDILFSVQRFLRDESGPTMVEYLFMLSLVIFAALVGIEILGNTTLELFTRTKNNMP